MEFHMKGEPEDISRYVLCPGSQSRAKKIAEQFDNCVTVSEERGIVVYSGTYKGVFMTSCGTGMGGPATAIAIEELGHLGADTFIRVGSCGALQEGQKAGDVIIANATVRYGGTGNAYLPVEYPAAATFEVTEKLVQAAKELDLPVQVGVGVTGDAFYGIERHEEVMVGNPLFVEMESDTLFLVGAVRGFRTGALFASDGAPGVIKPEGGQKAFARGVDNAINIALESMHLIAISDQS